MIKYFRFICLMSFVAILSSCSVPTAQNFPMIDSFGQVQHILDQADATTMVFFDCDETLISAYDYLPRHFVPPLLFRLLAMIRYPRLISDKAYSEQLFSLMLQQAPRFLIEPAVVQIINKLHQQGACVLAITGMQTGSFGVIKSMPVWRANMLNDLGIILTTKFNDVIFDTLPANRNNYPGLFHGLICCNGRAKGEVIGAFLDRLKLKPDTIILFDDTDEELASLNQECAKRGIRSLCFLYTAGSKLQQTPWNICRAFKQLDYLINFQTWISDENAGVV